MNFNTTQFTKFSLLGAAAAVALSGCATMRSGAFEKVVINTDPPGALCKIYREGRGFQKSIATPGAKMIQRGREPITIACSKKGYKTAILTEEMGTMRNDQGTLTNAANFGAGIVIDVSNAARYQTAGTYNITLEPLDQ